jgi:hypothetical protein
MGQHFFPILLSAALVSTAPGALGGEAWARRARFGYLELQSKTAGAQVIVDGELVGTVPLSKPLRLRRGKHTLKIALKGYTQFLDVVRVKPGATTKLEIDLIPIGGVVAVSATLKDARVFVDGTFVGMAPVETEALVGTRTIRVSRAGYHDFIKRIKVVGGQEYAVEAKLKPLPRGTTPYQPAPPPPPEWYEKWYVWAGAAAGVAAVAVSIVVPVVLTRGDPIEDFGGLQFVAQ